MLLSVSSSWVTVGEIAVCKTRCERTSDHAAELT